MSAPNNPNISYIDIIENGSFFSNPEERYGPGAHIVCDRCQSSPIRYGYGFGTQDLCMPCVEKVSNVTTTDTHVKPSSDECTLMMQDQFTSRIWGNNPRDEPAQSSRSLTFMLQDQFRSSATSEPTITTYMEQRQFWRTKMAAGMFDPPKPRSSGSGSDELARRLAEMQRLREQPIGSFDDVSGGISGFDGGGNSMGGSSLDAQFGSLLTPEPPRQPVPKPPTQTPSLQTPTDESRYGNGSALTRMSQGMFRTRMEMGMFRKK